MFKVGDHVVYPYHGAGTIEDIEEKNVLGETHSYYILHFPLVDVKLMLPENRIEQSGLRKVIAQQELDHLVEALQNGPENPLSTSHFSRDTENLLKSGSIIDAAHLISSLSKKQTERSNGLHIQDRNHLQKAKQMIASELVLMNDMTEEQAYEFIDQSLLDEGSA
ncbi:transcriptional regulator [Alkalihalobacillus alcalophilus ATCC 27647 = CGMCC 1.3604]|uniref:Transcriptional regulator n=1 Tax=Alkalihalobacillus alcalophilus ATCC 27647 = CGMCC 1.3604 TaxID=1218173 RepID=A0A094YR27_ALKAL|nr:CarD family transcriptional regulator [Alkalihalobacillus alcalophilus]KGA95922.1 transcriptional regulator [Alkalihalobacillus alcalophilus ATCC 27647 = CGMCC 1.3604]MED1563718.1 CarD family transcriptional regulator [Alkalihalobacillus alcalophilus]THG89688.1 transcriptional regulator [Alkalihalobacillus alcalophilus ATCC 27647 = CGMCC 1.3604]